MQLALINIHMVLFPYYFGFPQTISKILIFYEELHFIGMKKRVLVWNQYRKNVFVQEAYLNLLSQKWREDFAKLKLSAHTLHIYTGRYVKTNEWNKPKERLCIYCISTLWISSPLGQWILLLMLVPFSLQIRHHWLALHVITIASFWC